MENDNLLFLSNMLAIGQLTDSVLVAHQEFRARFWAFDDAAVMASKVKTAGDSTRRNGFHQNLFENPA